MVYNNRRAIVSFKNINYSLLFFMLSCFFSFTFPGLNLLAAESGSLLIKGDADYPPFEFLNKNQSADGFNVDIMQAVAEEMSLEIRIELDHWQKVRSEIEESKIDVVMGMYKTEERDKLVDFSIPHFIASYAVFCRKDTDIQSLEDISKRTIITQKGDFGYDYVMKNKIGSRVIAKGSIAEALHDLSSGLADCGIFPRLMATIILKESKIDNIRAVGPSILQRKYGFAVSEGNSNLLAKLNEGLSIIKTSGTYDRIYHKWFGVYEDKGWSSWQIFRYLLLFVVPLICIVFLFWGWNWSLKKKVDGKTKELQASREDLNITLNSIGDAVIATDLDGLITRMNPVAEKLSGWSLGEALAKPFNEVFHLINDLTHKVMDNPVENVLLAGSIKGLTKHTVLIGRDGTKYRVANSGGLIRNDKGETVGMVLVSRDVSEEYALQQRLRAESEYSGTIIKGTPAIICGITPDGTCTFINPAGEEITGYSQKEIVGRNWWRTFCSEDESGPSERLFQNFGLGEVHDYEMVLTTRDGSKRIIAWSSLNRFDGDGDLQEIIGFGNDVTKRKQSEEELRQLRNYLSNIIDSMPSILIGVDAENRVTQWNRTTERITGVPAAEAVGEILGDIFPQMSFATGIIKESIRSRQIKQEKKRARRLEDSTCFEDITIYPLLADNEEGAVIRVDDVTKQVRLEEMMIQNEKMLSVGGLAAGMAHEINNPLAGMMQAATVLTNRLEKDDLPANVKAAEMAGTSMTVIRSYMEARNIPRMVAGINKSGQRMATIISNMLSFSRKSDSTAHPHDLRILLDKTLELAATDYDLQEHYDFKRIEIKKNYQDNLPFISCEGSKIQQVLLNILHNGAQAMQKKNTEKPVFKVSSLFDEERQMVCVAIEDNGSGMDEAIHKRIFEPFFTTKPAGEGTGLGLSVSYFIITEDHKGEMEVESRLGYGSKFIIRLPLVK